MDIILIIKILSDYKNTLKGKENSLKLKGVLCNFMDKILDKNKHLKYNNLDKLLKFTSDYKFYLISTTTTSYVLAILRISDVEYIKIRFSLSGVVLNKIQDLLMEDNVILRKDDNTSFYIKNNTIFYSKQDLKLIPLVKPISGHKDIENPNIGVLDCETYEDLYGKYKIYS